MKVIVGLEKREFFVHEKVLAASSAFLQAALKEEWREGQARTIKLPEEDPTTFYGYIQWLYAGKLPCQSSEKYCFLPLAKLYVIGEKLIDDKLQDRVLDAIIATHRKEQCYPSKTTVKTIYHATPEGSPGRRLMVDMHLLFGAPEAISNKNEETHLDFLVDLTKALLKGRTISEKTREEHLELYSGTPCSYHKHGKDEPCSGKSE